MGYIYIITNTINAKVYIGQTTGTTDDRWKEHRREARRYLKYRDTPDKLGNIKYSCIYRAMAKHGIDNFHLNPITPAADSELNALETYYIKERNCIVPFGYNLNSGGGAGSKQHPETIKHMIEQKHARIDNIKTRSDKLKGMPPHVCYYNTEKNGEFLCVRDHPLCDYKYFSVKAYGSLDLVKHAVLDFLVELEHEGVRYVPPIRNNDKTDDAADIKIYKGLVETRKGYRVCKTHQKRIYDKRFERTDCTREENRANAIAWYLDLLTRLQLPIPQPVPQ